MISLAFWLANTNTDRSNSEHTQLNGEHGRGFRPNLSSLAQSKTENMNEAPRRSRGNFTKLAWIVPLVAIGIAIPSYYALVMVPKRQQLLRKHELMKAGLRYHMFYDVNSRPPANLDEFLDYEPAGAYALNQSDDMAGFADRVRKGRITVLWNSMLLKNGGESDQHLLAYESQAADSGGLVLMGGGSVKVVTAEEFATLPRLPAGGQTK